MAITVKEIFSGTTYTEGNTASRYDKATMALIVKGLADTRTQLDQAITSATATRLVHPDNTSLPLRYATARWQRGSDSSGTANAAAIVTLIYNKLGYQNATDATEFSILADVNVRYVTLGWYGMTRANPATEGAQASVAETHHGPDTDSGNANVIKPKQHPVQVPVWDISIPVTLASSPITTVAGTVGRINTSAFTIGGHSFPADSLRFDGLTQRATKVDTGASVTYEFDVSYRYAYMEGGWYWSDVVAQTADPKLFVATKHKMYERATFTAPPTS